MKDKINEKLILFTVGFCLYITIEVLFRGYSYPLMGIVGGISVLLLDAINNIISFDVDVLIQGSIGMSIITFFEFAIGTAWNYLPFIPVMWDYSNVPLNYKGVICVPFMFAWFALSLVGIFVADSINYYVFEELPVPYYKLFGKTILTFKNKKCKL